MRTMGSLALLAALALGLSPARLKAAQEDGVALAIIYDTSGSMRDSVRDESGGAAPKYQIANRALEAVTKQIQAFATNSASGTPRKIETGLWVFQGEGAREAVKFGPFDPTALHNFASNFSHPSGNTPLGNSLTVASRSVLNSSLSHKHILVITDGMNTAGLPPEAVLPRIRKQAEQKQTALAVHFVAFDVNAKVFDPVKRQGATVVSAADEKQLDSQLEYILQRKILLEEEETPGKSGK
jgi:hypothetical protein